MNAPMSVQMAPSADATTSLAHRLGTTALIVVVLGVLPLVWDAPAVWRVLGPLTALVFAAHAARAVWQDVFSTAPRHLQAS